MTAKYKRMKTNSSVHFVTKLPLLRKHNLKKRIESFHEGKKAFVCNICDLRFTQNGGLKYHIESVHEGKRRKKVKEM